MLMLPLGVYRFSTKQKPSTDQRIEIIQVEDVSDDQDLTAVGEEGPQLQFTWVPEYYNRPICLGLITLPNETDTNSLNHIFHFFSDIPPPAIA